MCDQTEVAYLPNDIVWVKLSNVWWPAEVQDEESLGEEITYGLRKKPLAVVKFFDEDTYEFPKNLNQIYHYNCLRKDEFIKKGLDMWRAEATRDLPYSMRKFPRDVEIAEVKTGGNPAYIYDPKFVPEEKFDYREHFGMKPLKKVKLERDSSSPLPQTYKAKPQTPKVTFYDLSNRSLTSGSTSRIRTPTEKVLSNSTRKNQYGTPHSILKTSTKYMRDKMPALTSFPCLFCDFSSKSVNGVILHYRTHYRGETLPFPPCVPAHYLSHFKSNQQKRIGSGSNRSVTVVSDKPPMKRKRLIDETETPKKMKTDTPKIIKRRAPATGNVSVSKAANVEEPPKPATQKKRVKRARSEVESEALEILKDWDDFSEDESDIPPKEDDLSINSLQSSQNESTAKRETATSPSQVNSPISSATVATLSTKTPEKSCFDFEDNDDALNLDLSLKFGQKLPRVINEKQPSSRRSRQVRMEDNLKNEVDNFLESAAQIPSLPHIPETLAKSDIVETSEENNVTGPKMNKEKDDTESSSMNLKTQEHLEDKKVKTNILSTDPDGISITSSEDSVFSTHSDINQAKKKFKADENLDSCSNNSSTITTSEIAGEHFPENQISDVKFGTLDTPSATDASSQQIASKEEKNTLGESVVHTSDQPGGDELVKKKNILELAEINNLDKTKIEGIEEGGDQSTDNYADSLIIDETESPEDKSHYATDPITTDSVDSTIADSTNNTLMSNKEHENANTVKETQQIEAIENLSSCKDVTQNKDFHATKIKKNDESGSATDNKMVEQEKDKIDELVSLDIIDKEKNNEIIELKADPPLSEIVKESMISDDMSITKEDAIIEEEEVTSKIENEMEKADCEKKKVENKLVKEEITSGLADNLGNCTKKKAEIIKEEKLIKKEEKKIKKEETTDTGNSSSTLQSLQDICLFDINSMPIIIQSDNENLSEMEICCGPGPFIPDPNADVITVYLRKKGEELPEDFEPGKEIFTIKAPPPDFVPCHNMKRLPFPEGKPVSSNAPQPTSGPSTSNKENRPTPSSSTNLNKENAAGSSNEVIVKPSTSGKVTGTRKSNLVSNTVGQQKQKQLLVLPPSTSGKFIITSPQGSIVTGTSSNTVSGARLLKPQLAGKVQKKTVPKQIVVSKGGNLPSTSKVTLSPQLINQIKSTTSGQSIVQVSTTSGQSIVQVKSQPGKIAVLTGPKPSTTSIKTLTKSVVQTEMKPPSSVPRGSRTNTTSKSGQKPSTSSVVTSALPERKHILKMKQSSPNILQKSPKKPLRQLKSQIVTIPKPSQSSDLVNSIQTAVVQNESTSADSVLYLAVENGNSVIPITSCEGESSSSSLLDDSALMNISSPSTSQNLDNIFLSIDGSNNFMKITNQSASSSQKSGAQDILAEALANTQVLQAESGELCEIDGTSIVTQEFPAPSLTNNVLETSLTYNTTPIMSTVEVPSSVPAGSQPSMPLLTDEIELKPQAMYINNPSATYQYIDVSGGNLSTTNDQQIVFTSLLSGDGKITTAENLLQTVAKEENVLPEFLKCDFPKRPEKSKKDPAQEEDP